MNEGLPQRVRVLRDVIDTESEDDPVNPYDSEESWVAAGCPPAICLLYYVTSEDDINPFEHDIVYEATAISPADDDDNPFEVPEENPFEDTGNPVVNGRPTRKE